MKAFVILLLSAFTLSLNAQSGLVEEFDEACNCTKVTNHYDGGIVSNEFEKNANGQKHGVEKTYYPNGNVQYVRTWANGKLNGEGTHYHPNGTIYYTEMHDNGVKTGEWKYMDEDGTLIQMVTYSGTNNDGVYDYYHAGVKYYTQTVSGGGLISETVLNQEIYDQLQEEAATSVKPAQ